MKKKGFTLIELLAVIVILAVIALIVTPIVTNVIEGARKGAANASALGYIDAVEKYMIMHDMNPEKYPYELKKGEKYYLIEDSSLIASSGFSFIKKVYAEEEVNNIYLNDFITVKGDMPYDGFIVIGSNNKVKSASLVIGNYKADCEDNVCESEKIDMNIVNVNSISISNTDKELFIGNTLKIDYVIRPEDATNKTVTWTSSDENIAIVDNNGFVTGISEGTATITAKTKNKKSATITLDVKKKIICKRAESATYGTIGQEGVLAAGDNFDCDLTGDGVFDERFYYISDYYDTTTGEYDNSYAVLMYSEVTTSSNYNDAFTNLPTIEEWPNVSLYKTTRTIWDAGFKKTLGDVDFSNYSARLLNLKELAKIESSYTASGALASYNYLMNPKGWILTENYSSVYDGAYYINCDSHQVIDHYRSTTYYIRPVIEISLEDIEY